MMLLNLPKILRKILTCGMLILGAVVFSLYTASPAAAQLDIEAIFDSNDGASGFDMQDVDNVTQVFIDSDGNIVTRGCVRLDDGLTECTDAETLIVDGTLGIGVTAPASVFHVDSNAAATTPIMTVENTVGDFQIHMYAGNPETVVTGSPGDLCIDPAGGMVYIKASGTATATGWTEVATGGGMPQWTQTGLVIHPNTETDDVGIGGTTEAGSDIFFGNDGRAVFNEQGAAVDFRIEGDTNENLVFVDGDVDRVGIGTSTPQPGTLLDLSASDAALRVTRLTNPSTSIATPRNGMIAYDSTDNELQAYVGGTWVMLAEGGMIDISDDTNITAGTGIVIIGDTIAVQDIYVLNGGDTMTGNLNVDASVVIGSQNAPVTGIILDLSASDAALRVTRLADPSTSIVSPRNGMIAYDSTEDELQAYVGGTWVMLAEGGMIDISDDTNLTAGNGISITGDTIAVQDIYVLTAGDTMTGTLTLGVTPVDIATPVGQDLTIQPGAGGYLILQGTMGIGTSSPAAGTILDLSASDAALRLTRLADPSADVAAPSNGMIAYDATDNELQAYIDGTWIRLSEAGMIDISDDTNLTAGTGISIIGDTIAVQDIYVLNAGDTMTGNLNVDAQVVIGSQSAPETSIILDLSAADRALRVTRVANPSVNIVQPRNGMIAY
ncbi:MAG: hypothetical protein KC900_12565, partial [Candidatus Omnitrophica bacterium]|nr:hypothetical protein [Candidatus Omnitrophota bacterium]